MADIKARDTVKGTIKAIDKSTVAAERMKDAFIRIKEEAQRGASPTEDNPEEYAADKVTGHAKTAFSHAAQEFDKLGRKAARQSVHPQTRPFSDKSHFLRAFKSMGLDNAEADALYTTTRGNMRALIRKIPGCTNEDRPDWANLDSLHLLIPITFLRSFHPVRDRKLVEQLSGTSYTVIENKYNELLRLEDSPIKRVGEYYSVVDFESTFAILRFIYNIIMKTRR